MAGQDNHTHRGPQGHGDRHSQRCLHTQVQETGEGRMEEAHRGEGAASVPLVHVIREPHERLLLTPLNKEHREVK